MKTKTLMTMVALLGMSPIFAQDAKPAGDAPCPAGEPKACAVKSCDAKPCDGKPCPPPCCPMEELTIETITLAAANGDPIAQYMLAYMTETGQGVPQDATKASEMYAAAVPNLQKAADAGNPRACRTLARAYAEGKGVTPDPVKAEAYMKKAKECKQKKDCCMGKKGHKHAAPKGCCKTAPDKAAGGAAAPAAASSEAPADVPAAAPAAAANTPPETAEAEVIEMTVEGEAAPEQGE